MKHDPCRLFSFNSRPCEGATFVATVECIITVVFQLAPL